MKNVKYIIIASFVVMLAGLAFTTMNWLEVSAFETGRDLSINLSETLKMTDSIQVFKP